MKKGITLKEIERSIEELAPREQLKLIEKLVHMLMKSESFPSEKNLDWNELYGLGKGLWEDEDAQEYVNRSREERI